MIAQWVSCPAGCWTRICQTAALSGFVFVSSTDPTRVVRYREYSAGIPYYLQNTARFATNTLLWVGALSLYLELWVCPPTNVLMKVS